MTDFELSEPIRRLLHQHLPSMDHVALLLAFRADPECRDVNELVSAARLQKNVAAGVLADLTASHLLQRSGAAYVYAPGSDMRELIDELANLYNSKPVTLVRAIYDRPASAARSFADAFRIRKTEG
ncbi:MAG: hypothetical protein M3Z05_05960 [Gemmatimonadota bacterium]|nr:hypothetical protein [Gemmatimonadota bacterium]